MTHAPRVSIVMAMHNATATVAQALESLQRQTEPSWEAIIVDDGSTDACAEIAERFAQDDSRFSIVHQANAGAGAARNAGLDRCHGEFVGFLDADDWLEPDALEALLAEAGRASADAVCGQCALADERGRPIDWSAGSLPAEIGLAELHSREAFAIHSQLIRRSILGGTRFSTDLRCFEDADLYLRLAERGLRWRVLNKVVCTYRQRPRDRGTPAHAAMFSTIQRVFTSSFERLRRLELAGVDVSDAALDRILWERAFKFATMMVLQDGSARKDRAASVLAGLARPLRISASDAASAAHGYLPWSECRDVKQWTAHLDRYSAAVIAWWRRCVDEGWAESGLIEGASAVLARLIANETDIAARLIAKLDSRKTVTLLGAGRNAARIAEGLQKKRIPFVVVDRNLERATRLAARYPKLGGVGEWPTGSEQCIMTLLDDESFLRQLPRDTRPVRWADEVAMVAKGIEARLLDAACDPSQAS